MARTTRKTPRPSNQAHHALDKLNVRRSDGQAQAKGIVASYGSMHDLFGQIKVQYVWLTEVVEIVTWLLTRSEVPPASISILSNGISDGLPNFAVRLRDTALPWRPMGDDGPISSRY